MAGHACRGDNVLITRAILILMAIFVVLIVIRTLRGTRRR
jgi:hypothetical protein